MTYRCDTCDVNWWPYQTRHGACLRCGGGTRRTGEAADPDAGELHRAALATVDARERSEKLRADFDAFYEQREARLNGLDVLPVSEPERRLAA